jgi:uncharacterized membrane protein
MPPQQTPPMPMSDAGNDKIMAILAYVFFLIPLLVGSKSPYVRFHTNQGTVLAIFSFAGILVSIFIGTIVPFLFLLMPLYNLCLFILWLIGLIGAIKGEMKVLPVIGGIKIIS